MTDDVVVEDWLWDDDVPEEPAERELTHEERMLRRSAIRTFVGSIVGLVALVILGVVAFRVFSDDPVRDLPAACTKGRISDCPTRRDLNREPRSKLPGGFDPRTGESEVDGSGPGLTEREAEARIAKCLDGKIEFCG